MPNIEIQGSEILVAQLLALPDKVRKAVEREAVAEANKLLIGTMRSNAPKESGALQKSIGSVVRNYKSGGIVIGVVGSKSDYAGSMIRKGTKKAFRKAKKNENQKGFRRPAKYLHLIELGTAQRKTKDGKNRGTVTPNPFMERSLESVKAQVQQIFENAVKKAVDSG